MRRDRAVALVALAAVMSGGCSRGAEPPAAERELRIAMRRPSSVDPVALRDASGIFIARQVFRPLTSFDPPTSDIRPGAASWEALDGGTRFIFHLKGGNSFGGGREVNAEDVRFALNRLARKTTGSEAAFLLDAVAGFNRVNLTGEVPELDGIRTIDARTLEVRLSAAWFDFPYVLGHPSTAPVPKEEFEANPAGFVQQPIGSGAYKLAGGLEQGKDALLVAVAPRGEQPRLVKILFYERADDAWRDFQAGVVDIAEVPPGKVGLARGKYGESGLSPMAAAIFLGFNLRNPKLQDVRVRQAISLAIDREQIARSIYGDAVVPARGLIPEGIPGRSEAACGNNCTRDIRRAKQLVKAVFGDAPVSIAYDYPAGPTEEAMAKSLKSSLAEVGIPLELRPRGQELTSFFDVIQSGSHEIYRLAWPAEYPAADWFLNPLFRSNSLDNHSGYAAPEVDDLLNRARATAARRDRLALYRVAEKRVLADMVVVPVGFFLNRFVASKRVEGFYADRLGGFELSRLEIR